MKKILCILLVIMLSCAAAGCGVKIDADIMPDELQTKQEFEFAEFKLSESGQAGIIASPTESESVPVVFVMYNNESKQNDYSYLVKHLASYGYLTVGIDIDANINDRIKKETEEYYTAVCELISNNTDALKNVAASETASAFGVELFNKGDLTNIGLIWCNEDAKTAYSVVQNSGEIVKGQLLIAPAKDLPGDENYADIKTGILLCENDGFGMVGQDIFETIQSDWEKTAWISYAYLYGASSKGFGYELKTDGAENLSFEEGQDFLCKYSVDFMNAVFMKQNKPSMLMLSEFNKETMYGYRVKTAISAPGSKVLVDGDAGDLHPQNASIALRTSTYNKETNELEGFFRPGVQKGVKLYNFNWDNVDIPENGPAQAIYYVAEGSKDFSEYKYLAFYMTPNPTTGYKFIPENLDCSIELTDYNDKKSSIKVNSKTPALEIPKGEMKNNIFSKPIPLGTLAIPLCKFTDINMQEIKTVKMYMGEGGSGSIAIGEISLVKSLNNKTLR